MARAKKTIKTNSSHFKPGVSGNPAGRPKGAKDKGLRESKKQQEALRLYLAKKLGPECLNRAEGEMSAKEWVKFLLEMAKLLWPKETEIKKKVSTNVQIELNYENNLDLLPNLTEDIDFNEVKD